MEPRKSNGRQADSSSRLRLPKKIGRQPNHGFLWYTDLEAKSAIAIIIDCHVILLVRTTTDVDQLI